MLQLPVMHNLVARHLWTVRTISPLRRDVCQYSQLELTFFLASLFQSRCAAWLPTLQA